MRLTDSHRKLFFTLRLAARLVLVAAFLTFHFYSAQGSSTAPQNEDKESIVIEDASDGDVFTYNKNIVIKGKVKKGVMTFGGDVTIEERGRIEGDVASFGGSVRQREKAFIGGDVIVLGGKYEHADTPPQRSAESHTVIYAGYEDELREIAYNPAVLVAPALTPSYVAQRIIAALFWFVIGLLLTTISPGAFSRAITRLNLSSLRVAVIGSLAMLTGTVGVALGLRFLPTTLSVGIGLMTLMILLLAYVFGYVTIQVATGKYLQKRLFGDKKRSDSVALLLGVSFWAIILSLPYVWAVTLVGLLTVSFGLLLTARPPLGWTLERKS